MTAEPITRRQMARIWASAHALKLTREELYALIPGGSISHLTRGQATEVIQKLSAHGSQPSAEFPPWQMTEAQRQLILHMVERLGWTDNPHRIQGFLRKYAHVDDLEHLTDRKKAIAVIEALKAILARPHRGMRKPAEREETPPLLASQETSERHELN
jgi:hypothetical protein